MGEGSIGPFYVFKGESCSDVGLHEVLYLGPGVIGQGDSDGIGLATLRMSWLLICSILTGSALGPVGFNSSFTSLF